MRLIHEALQGPWAFRDRSGPKKVQVADELLFDPLIFEDVTLAEMDITLGY